MRRAAIILLCVALTICLAGPSRGHDTLVLFDQGHGQRFTVEGKEPLDLSRLAGVIKKQGGDVRALTGRIDEAALAGAKALVVSGPFKPFEESETAAIQNFVNNGGRLSVMLHIAPPVSDLLKNLGVTHSMGVVHEEGQIIGGNPLDFTVSRMEDHFLLGGLADFAVYGGWAVKNMGRNAIVIARTGPRAWLDLNRSRAYEPGEPVESLGIVVAGSVGDGSFLVFGDDAIFQGRFLDGNNLALAQNLAEWLLK
jgi:hypothetical protein